VGEVDKGHHAVHHTSPIGFAPDLIPWAWDINGCTSVLASILSAMLAISFGFSRVLLGASVAYVAALGVIYPLASGESFLLVRRGNP
jgi:hypothetical protein